MAPGAWSLQALKRLALLAPLLLVGCSGTPFGDQLSRSFSAPPQSPAAGAPAQPAVPAAKPAAPAKPAQKPQPQAKPAAPAADRAPALPPAAPAPYRVTIKLPAADPSAPAEVVTEALRAAGVAFEVETIERVPAGADAAPAPLRSPAPPAR